MAPHIGVQAARRSGWLVLLTTALAACTQWQVQNVPPEQLVATRHPARIRVTMSDSSKVVLTNPEIVNDTLYATTAHAGSTSASGSRDGIALADVSHLAIRRTDPIATGVLIAVPAAALVGAAFIIRAAIIAGSD